MNWYIAVLKKYAVFTGRARRKEYWMFILFNIIIGVILGIIEEMSGISSGGDTGMLVNIYQLAILIPSLAVAVRRMHDVGKNGWFIIVPIYNLILSIREGDKGNNQYGPDPKADI